jgi:hypothetical protein
MWISPPSIRMGVRRRLVPQVSCVGFPFERARPVPYVSVIRADRHSRLTIIMPLRYDSYLHTLAKGDCDELVTLGD